MKYRQADIAVESNIAMMTAADVHSGKADMIRHQRQQVLQKAYQEHPERFVKGMPQAQPLPEAVWINKPTPLKSDVTTGDELPLNRGRKMAGSGAEPQEKLIG